MFHNFTLNENTHRIVIMKKLLVTFFTVLFCLTLSVGWSVTMDDLFKRDGLYYKKFTEVPFTGKTDGKSQGSFKNGKREGSWAKYWYNGQLWNEGDYKNGKREGSWIGYYKNGQLHYKNNYKNNKMEGSWVSFHKNGQLNSKGDFKNGKKEGLWLGYYGNGQLLLKGQFKNGLQEGSWIGYHDNGTINMRFTATFKNGQWISD